MSILEHSGEVEGIASILVAMVTSAACQDPSGAPQDTFGEVASLDRDRVAAGAAGAGGGASQDSPVVSLVTELESQPVCDVMLDSGSFTVQLTVTFAIYQPLLRAPVTLGVMTGGVVSADGTIARLW
jgi:hypothetical protein